MKSKESPKGSSKDAEEAIRRAGNKALEKVAKKFGLKLRKK